MLTEIYMTQPLLSAINTIMAAGHSVRLQYIDSTKINTYTLIIIHITKANAPEKNMTLKIKYIGSYDGVHHSFTGLSTEFGPDQSGAAPNINILLNHITRIVNEAAN